MSGAFPDRRTGLELPRTARHRPASRIETQSAIQTFHATPLRKAAGEWQRHTASRRPCLTLRLPPPDGPRGHQPQQSRAMPARSAVRQTPLSVFALPLSSEQHGDSNPPDRNPVPLAHDTHCQTLSFKLWCAIAPCFIIAARNPMNSDMLPAASSSHPPIRIRREIRRMLEPVAGGVFKRWHCRGLCAFWWSLVDFAANQRALPCC